MYVCMYVCQSRLGMQLSMHYYAHAYVHSIDILYLLPRDFFYLAGAQYVWTKGTASYSQRQEARRHQHASRATENEQRRWFRILSDHIFKQAWRVIIEACWWRLASCRWTSGFMLLLCRCLRSLASCLFHSDILSSGQVLQITYNYLSSLIYHCLLI